MVATYNDITTEKMISTTATRTKTMVSGVIVPLFLLAVSSPGGTLFATAATTTSSGSSSSTESKLNHGRFKQSIDLLEKIFADDTRRHFNNNNNNNNNSNGSHGHRGLQQSIEDLDLPPPFTPERGCNEAFATLTVEEVGGVADLYLGALFPPGSENEAIGDLARGLLLSQAQYDVTLAKVCMSCAEARNFISLSDANNDEDKYGFANYCSDGMFGADNVQQSALLMIPNEPGTENGEFVKGQVRGAVSIRGTTPDLYASPSAFMPANMTQYLGETPFQVAIPALANYLVAMVMAASGVIVSLPDVVGYGESSTNERAYFVGLNYAQGVVLGWVAAEQFVLQKSSCTSLEPTATVIGYSEGGTAAINGALALEKIGVNIFSAFPAGAVYQPSLQFAYLFDQFASDTLPTNDALNNWKVFLPMIGYSTSINNNLLPNAMKNQNLLSEEYSTGDFTTNIYDWFNPPGQLSVGSAFVQFVPDIVTDVLNQDLANIYAEARALGEQDACTNFVSNTTDALCATILAEDLISDLSDLVGFPTIVCHSDDDELVTADQIPTFPFEANPLVTRFTGVPGVISIMGSHGVASILCSVSPLVSLTEPGDSSPINIVPLDECRTTGPPTTPAPTPTAPTPSPVQTPTPAPPTDGSAGSSFTGKRLLISLTLWVVSTIALMMSMTSNM